jgi:16S rRNA (uracil1498-N3)-methyltransferase
MTHPKTRLFVATDLAGGLSVGLEPSQAHYVKSVLRIAPGSVVALFNGRDGEWLGRVDGLGKGWCSVTLFEQSRRQEASGDLWLVFAPVKRGRIDFLVEKATELGVAALHPVHTRHTMVERVNLERLRVHAVEAAEQTERLSVPEIAEPEPLERLMARWPAARRLLLCDESGASPPIAEALAGAAPGAWAVLVGPEGGFAETELDALKKLPFVCPVGLGPRVLRTDTAALAALAVLQALAGDWRVPRRR